MTTISAEHAKDLFHLYDDHAPLPEDEQDHAHGWTVLGSSPSGRDGRWHERYWMLLRNEAGETYGVEYGVGLTEDQEDDYPWSWGTSDIPLLRLYPHTVTTVKYRTKPAEVSA